jgi:hypothetical protein
MGKPMKFKTLSTWVATKEADATDGSITLKAAQRQGLLVFIAPFLAGSWCYLAGLNTMIIFAVVSCATAGAIYSHFVTKSAELVLSASELIYRHVFTTRVFILNETRLIILRRPRRKQHTVLEIHGNDGVLLLSDSMFDFDSMEQLVDRIIQLGYRGRLERHGMPRRRSRSI